MPGGYVWFFGERLILKPVNSGNAAAGTGAWKPLAAWV
jgi:hypothetical protein